jgi:cobalt-zinc-cadmium resistance protein CzcA
MIKAIIGFSVRNKLFVLLMVLGIVGLGLSALSRIPIDAVPDITNNQVQVVTVSPFLAAQEVEQFITYPVELALANIPNVVEIRSISRFGLSVVTVVFKDWVHTLHARQYVREQLSQAEDDIPPGLGKPDLMPITTGLGEIYQYVLRVKPGYEQQYDAMELRTIQDWIVKRQLAGIPGIIEVSSFGGYLKQYEVAIEPHLLRSYGLAVAEVFEALSRNNQNSGGSYIEKGNYAYYIRTEGIVQSTTDIEQIVVGNRQGIPVLIRDVGKVQFGSPKRFGAMTMDGQGEVVGGITLMLKGANASATVKNVRERIAQVQQSLPEGVELYAYLDRSDLVEKTIATVRTNLLEGGLIVVLVLILLLGNWRAALIVASIIPLSMLFALIFMDVLGVSANLMSLGAIDFGIVVDGAIIVVEGVLHALFTYHVGKQLSRSEMDGIVTDASAKLFRTAVFGVFIILVVFIPVMTLTDIEGKMFRPMAITFSLVITGALFLALTYVPVMASLVLSRNIRAHRTWADRFMEWLKGFYRPTLEWALRWPKALLATALVLLLGSVLLFFRLGAVFIPTLEEGDLAMQMTIQPGSSLEESIRAATKAEQILLDHFPEVEHVVSKIGTAEVPTDPMAIEDADIMIILKEKAEWVSATDREELADKMKDALEVVAGAEFEFTQPIQLRFNELMTGAKTDIAVKIFGENTAELKRLGDRAAQLIEGMPGAADVKVEQTEGLPQLMIQYDRARLAQHGLHIADVNTLVRTAFAGEVAGVVFENERKFDLVVRLAEAHRQDLDLNRLFINLPAGAGAIPLSEVAAVHYAEGPMQISRENTRRRINVGINVRDRDIASLVADISAKLEAELRLPPGYTISYGGQFENLEKARERLNVAVPVALLLIFILLFFTFGRLKYALMISTAVPLSIIGGVLALWLRGMPFSISAGVGFIALFGVAVLNGIVLISYFNRLRYEEGMDDLREIVIHGSLVRLRPVIMTATTTALGFLPMALSTSNGAEVQKPLATVVIGGLLSSTLLTLIILPILYYMVNRRVLGLKKAAAAVVPFLLMGSFVQAQQSPLTLEAAVQHALTEHPSLKNSAIGVQQAVLGIEAARQIPPMNLSLDIGQHNTSLIDYQLSVTQSFPLPGVNRQRQEAARARLAVAQGEQGLLQHQIVYQVQQQWYSWLYQRQRYAALAAQAGQYEELAQRAGIQYQVGEIGQLENALAQSRLAQAQQAATAAQLAVEQAFIRLLQVAFLPAVAAPPDSLAALPLPAVDPAEALASFLRPLRLQVLAAEEEAEAQAQLLKPELLVGYFSQSIRPDWPLQAVHTGLALPIFQKPQRARIEQAQLESVRAVNELQRQQRLLEQERQLALQQMQGFHQQLQDSGQRLQRQAAQLRHLAALQLRAGEIDYFQYVQSLEAAFANELQYLDLVEQYNQANLFFQFLSK